MSTYLLLVNLYFSIIQTLGQIVETGYLSINAVFNSETCFLYIEGLSNISLNSELHMGTYNKS